MTTLNGLRLVLQIALVAMAGLLVWTAWKERS